jgi:hypothetical protein
MKPYPYPSKRFGSDRIRIHKKGYNKGRRGKRRVKGREVYNRYRRQRQRIGEKRETKRKERGERIEEGIHTLDVQ